MELRILPREEYHRLAGTELDKVWPMLPANAVVEVVEEEPGGKILGCWSFYTLVHAEGVWIDPKHRGKAAVAQMLLEGMKLILKLQFDGSGFITGATNDQVAGIIMKLGGQELPGKHYAVPVGIDKEVGAGEEEACPPR